jgi:hypothetical protein
MENLKLSATVITLGVLLYVAGGQAVIANAARPEEKRSVDANDPTYRLFQFLNTTRGGKLKDFYVLGDVYHNPKDPSQEYRHVLRVEYDNMRIFGRFRIYVRSVGRMTPAQRATYTSAQIYEFAVVDEEKFEKIEPGPFGQPGDLYFRAEQGGPLHSAPTTDAARNAYEDYVTHYILPALEKEQHQQMSSSLILRFRGLQTVQPHESGE